MAKLIKKFGTSVGPPSKKEIQNQATRKNEEDSSSAYPLYPPEEDIFNKDKKEELNPEDPTKRKVPYEKPGKMNEKDFEEDVSGSDLDVPGSETDDEEALTGSEDEENQYFSIGGDDHDKLDED